MLFFGHVFSEKVLPDPRRLRLYKMLLQPMPLKYEAFLAPLHSALDSLIARSLRQLTCDGTRWQWTQEEQLSFERLKEALSINITLGYFASKRPTSNFVDGNPIGLGAFLTQEAESSKEVTPRHYASCPLTPTQARYP